MQRTVTSASAQQHRHHQVIARRRRRLVVAQARRRKLFAKHLNRRPVLVLLIGPLAGSFDLQSNRSACKHEVKRNREQHHDNHGPPHRARVR